MAHLFKYLEQLKEDGELIEHPFSIYKSEIQEASAFFNLNADGLPSLALAMTAFGRVSYLQGDKNIEDAIEVILTK